MATTGSRASHGHRSAPSEYPRSSARGARGGNGGGNGRGGSGNGRGPRRRRRPNLFVRIIGFLANLILFLSLLVIAIGVAAYLATIRTMPTTITAIENYRPSGQTIIYSSDGAVLAKIFEQDRQTVTIDKVPKQLQDATVAIEDSRFWTNNAGFDIRGIGRALWKDAVGGDATAQGGSTITQQLVRNLGIGGVGHEKTWNRKVREIIYANQIERNYSKQQILEMYLNAVYYGSGAYGVQAASQVYFGKTVDQLDLAQCALIAGLPRSPSGYSPYNHLDAATTRRNVVLGRMRDLGYITDDQFQQAVAEPVTLASAKQPDTGSRTFYAPFFVDYVVKYLTNEYGSDFVYRGGINVYTTLNLQMQQAAERAVAQHMADMRYTGATQAALVCMEAQTGYIKAMVGGLDYSKSQFNIAADGRRQPGSSFKPIYYTAALDSGIIQETTALSNEPISFPGANGGVWRPQNDDHSVSRWVSAKEAIEMSMNVPSVRVLKMVGIDTAIRYARMMGVQSPLAPYMTLALGASAVTPLEMADVYATIDNGGARPIPTPVQQITDSSGQVLEDDPPKLETTGISADACAEMSDMLRGVVTEGTASGAFRANNPPDAHGKTGTTQDHRDVWFDGYTKDLVTTIWAGHPTVDPKTGRPAYLPMTGEAFGATICAPIWRDYMIAAGAIEKQAQARELQLDKTKTPVIVPANSPAAGQAGAQPDDDTADDSDNGPDNTDNTSGNSSAIDDGSASGADTNNPPDTTTVWIDNDTGQPTTPNAPNSHQETFAKGYAPVAPTDNSGAGPGQPGGANGAGENQDTSGSTTPAQSQGSQPGGTEKATSISGPTYTPASSPKLVTVTVCAESGLLATKWCPETISETFVAGTQPKKYCTIHKPPPGEH
jgi:penicillin-binding protein 1A